MEPVVVCVFVVSGSFFVVVTGVFVVSSFVVTTGAFVVVSSFFVVTAGAFVVVISLESLYKTVVPNSSPDVTALVVIKTCAIFALSAVVEDFNVNVIVAPGSNVFPDHSGGVIIV